jgi:very-short-patch-repair endonuclease
MQTQENRIGCKIFNHLPWHSEEDLLDFFGRFLLKKKSDYPISKNNKAYAATLNCEVRENDQLKIKTIKHYSFDYVAQLCEQIKSKSHSNRYHRFLTELGIVWTRQEELDFSGFMNRLFNNVLDIQYQHQVGRYVVDGYVQSLNVVLEFDGKEDKLLRKSAIKKTLGAEIIRAPQGDYSTMANKLISRMLKKNQKSASRSA